MRKLFVLSLAIVFLPLVPFGITYADGITEEEMIDMISKPMKPTIKLRIIKPKCPIIVHRPKAEGKGKTKELKWHPALPCPITIYYDK
jgi:hypothetical protein